MASFLASPLAGVVAVAGVYVASIYLVGGSFATFGLVIALYAHFYLFEWHKKANVRRTPGQQACIQRRMTYRAAMV
jgi:hypothetical protein